jgi:hypothetical protein
MITDRFSGNVYLAVGSTDMRKAINGLSILVEQAMGVFRDAPNISTLLAKSLKVGNVP